MAQHGKDIGYSIFRIFIVLFVLTAIEVVWGMFFRDPRWLLWFGLITCMVIKGLLIFMYFMHMRFERFIVWSLVVPTPALVAIVVCALLPDVAFNDDHRDHPVGYLIDKTGEVVNALDPHHPAVGRGTAHGQTPDAEHGAPAPAGGSGH